MGQNSSKANWSIQDALARALLTDNYPTDADLRLYLDASVSANAFRNKYIVKLDASVGPDNLAVIFPHHPTAPYLWTKRYTSLERLSRDINERLEACGRLNERLFGVTNGNRIVWFHRALGPVYLFWASCVNMQTINSEENEIGRGIPLIIETNGELGYRNVYLFSDERLLCMKDISVIPPIRSSLFCCDRPPPRDTGKHIRTLSKREADQLTEEPVVRRLVTLEGERMPYTEDHSEDFILLDSGRFTRYSLGDGNPLEPDEGEF